MVAFASVLALVIWSQAHMDGSAPVSIAVRDYADRLAVVREAWPDAERHTQGRERCPTVAELDRLAPELRGVLRAERDYASLLEGGDC